MKRGVIGLRMYRRTLRNTIIHLLIFLKEEQSRLQHLLYNDRKRNYSESHREKEIYRQKEV